MTDCWLAEFSDTACSGGLTKAHLIKQQTIRRELRLAKPRRKGKESGRRAYRIIWDQRVWVPACQLHHHALDSSRKLRIPRERLPAGLPGYAEEHGLSWWVEREYGPLQADSVIPT